jgi:hypothetical protein
MQRGKKIEVSCDCCKIKFTARVADRKRGWARFCSKSCKALHQNKSKTKDIKLNNFNNKNEKDDKKMTNSINESALIVTLSPEQFQFVKVDVPNRQVLTYKAPKGLYAEGDLVVVEVGSIVTTGTIVSTEVKFTEIENNFFYKWVLAKFSLSEIEVIKAKEADVLEKIREAQQLHQQKAIRDGVLSQLGVNIEDIFKTDNLLESSLAE